MSPSLQLNRPFDEWTIIAKTLFLSHSRILGLDPFFPGASGGNPFQKVNFLPSRLLIFLCQTDTRFIVHSGAIEDDCLVLGILLHPGSELHGIFSPGHRKLHFAVIPVMA
jgi:hypothetical protein